MANIDNNPNSYVLPMYGPPTFPVLDLDPPTIFLDALCPHLISGRTARRPSLPCTIEFTSPALRNSTDVRIHPLDRYGNSPKIQFIVGKHRRGGGFYCPLNGHYLLRQQFDRTQDANIFDEAERKKYQPQIWSSLESTFAQLQLELHALDVRFLNKISFSLVEFCMDIGPNLPEFSHQLLSQITERLLILSGGKMDLIKGIPHYYFPFREDRKLVKNQSQSYFKVYLKKSYVRVELCYPWFKPQFFYHQLVDELRALHGDAESRLHRFYASLSVSSVYRIPESRVAQLFDNSGVRWRGVRSYEILVELLARKGLYDVHDAQAQEFPLSRDILRRLVKKNLLERKRRPKGSPGLPKNYYTLKF